MLSLCVNVRKVLKYKDFVFARERERKREGETKRDGKKERERVVRSEREEHKEDTRREIKRECVCLCDKA